MPSPQVLWIICASMLFGVMGVCVKFASAHFSVMELVFYRSSFGVLFVLAVARFWRRTLLTPNFRVHLWRGIAGFISLCLFFYALPILYLSTSMALLQTSPLFFAMLSAMLLRERMPPPLLFALAASFFGMLLVLRPDMDSSQLLAGGAALGAGAAAGFAYFNIRRLGMLNEGGIRTVFYFASISTVLSGLAFVFGYVEFSPMSATGAGWILAIGVTATVGQFTLTRGLHYGETLVASSLMYASVIFAGIFDYVLWGDALDAAALAGVTLIVGGGIGALSFNYSHRDSHPPARG